MGNEKHNSIIRKQNKKMHANRKSKLFCGDRVRNNTVWLDLKKYVMTRLRRVGIPG